jgi:hypothetical protein
MLRTVAAAMPSTGAQASCFEPWCADHSWDCSRCFMRHRAEVLLLLLLLLLPLCWLQG